MTEFNTRLVHGPAQNDNQTGAVNVPIYTSTTYRYPKIGAAVQYDYGRSGNPTRQYLEDQLAALEHGTRGLALSSGMAAIHTALRPAIISSLVIRSMAARFGCSISSLNAGG